MSSRKYSKNNYQTKKRFNNSLRKFWNDYHITTSKMKKQTDLYNKSLLEQMGGVMECEETCPIALDGIHDFRNIGIRWDQDATQIDLLECQHCLCRKWD